MKITAFIDDGQRASCYILLYTLFHLILTRVLQSGYIIPHFIDKRPVLANGDISTKGRSWGVDGAPRESFFSASPDIKGSKGVPSFSPISILINTQKNV